MTLDELMTAVLALAPNATVDEDADGQIVISTNLHVASAAGDVPAYLAELEDAR